MAALKSAVWRGVVSWRVLCSLPAATPTPAACPGSLTCPPPPAQALGEPLYRVSTGNYEYRLILRCRQEARARFSQMRKDVLEKMELLDQKHGEGLRAPGTILLPFQRGPALTRAPRDSPWQTGSQSDPRWELPRAWPRWDWPCPVDSLGCSPTTPTPHPTPAVLFHSLNWERGGLGIVQRWAALAGLAPSQGTRGQ